MDRQVRKRSKRNSIAIQRLGRPARVASGQARAVDVDTAPAARGEVASARSHPEVVFAGVALAALFLMVNWSSLAELVETWNREPDYSHGYLVAPIAVLFLWLRRDRYPRNRTVPGWGGFVLLALSVLLTFGGRRYFLNPLVFWGMIAWIGGAVWILGGRQVFFWALPAIAFLIFMVPLPYRLEDSLSGPLQRLATHLSCWTLQLFGQPAFAEGNTIFLGMTQLEVEHACSGLRMLVMVTALATACAVLVCRNWAERVFIGCCIIPVALFANCVRIVATGLACQYLSNDASKAISHDFAGWVVVPVAVATMCLALLYWRCLFVECEQVPLPVSRQPAMTPKGVRSHGDAL